MAHPFEAYPSTIRECDQLVTAFLMAWRDWLAARKDLADNYRDPACHARLAQADITFRIADGEMRRYLRYLQQARHLRGGTLRKPPTTCGKLSVQWRELGKPSSWLGCPLPPKHTGPCSLDTGDIIELGGAK